MTNITNVPEGICFLSQLGEIVINETSYDNRRVEIYPDPYLDGTAVKSRQPALYNEVLYVDSNHNITLMDVAELLQPYITGYHVREFMLKVGSEIAVFAVVNSGEIDMCASAERFLEQCFLTIGNGIRRTVAGNREVLHYSEMRQLSLMRSDCCSAILWTMDCAKGRTPVKAELAINIRQPYDIVGYVFAYLEDEKSPGFGDTVKGCRNFPFVIKAGDLKTTVEFADEYVWYYPEIYGATFASYVDMANRKYIDLQGQEHGIYDIERKFEESLPEASFSFVSGKPDLPLNKYFGFVNVPEGGTEPKYEDVRAEFLADLGMTEEQYTMPSMYDITPFVRAYYADGSYKDFPVSGDSSVTKAYVSLLCRMASLDVSPLQYQEEGKVLMRYVVTCGVRTMEYVMDTDHVEDIGRTVVVFLNSFGVPEFLYCNGIRNAEPEYERNSTFINGAYRTYKIKETRFWEVNTGILTEEEEDWFLDMLRSKNVYLCERRNGVWQEWKEIVITECEAKTDNDPSVLHSYKFKYRLSQKRQASVRVNDMPEIFTDEFNRIFR